MFKSTLRGVLALKRAAVVSMFKTVPPAFLQKEDDTKSALFRANTPSKRDFQKVVPARLLDYSYLSTP